MRSVGNESVKNIPVAAPARYQDPMIFFVAGALCNVDDRLHVIRA
jgi:hypothetical protein